MKNPNVVLINYNFCGFFVACTHCRDVVIADRKVPKGWALHQGFTLCPSCAQETGIMSRKYHITLEVEMEDQSSEADAATWAAALLSTGLKKPASEHPYKPRVVGAEEQEQPRPRRLSE